MSSFQMTLQQKTEFDYRYPAARAYILRCELKNEYNFLKTYSVRGTNSLNEWELKRLKELEDLFINNPPEDIAESINLT